MSIVNNAAGVAAVNIQDGGNSITVDGTLAVSSIVPGTGATDLGKAEDAAHSSGDTGVFALGIRNDADATFVGTNLDYSGIAVDIAGRVKVNLGTGNTDATGPLKQEDAARVGSSYGVHALAVRNDALASLVSTNLDYSSFSVDSAGRQYVAGQVAHDAAAAGNPVAIGAIARTADPTAVASDDAVRLVADTVGRLITSPFAPADQWIRRHLENGTTTEQTLVAAGGAGVLTNLVSFVFVNDSTSTATNVFLRNGAGGSIFMNVRLAPNTTVTLSAPIPYRGSANTAITATSSAAVDWKATVSGFFSTL